MLLLPERYVLHWQQSQNENWSKMTKNITLYSTTPYLEVLPISQLISTHSNWSRETISFVTLIAICLTINH